MSGREDLGTAGLGVAMAVVLVAIGLLILVAASSGGPPWCLSLGEIPWCVEVSDPARRAWD